MSQGNLEGLLNCSLEKLKGLVDVNTIIGEPITAPDGTIIVPVSKVAFGYGSGGSGLYSGASARFFQKSILV